MAEGARTTELRRRAKGAALGLGAALPGALFFRGFTVDDALITARVASNLAAGQGHRFNPGGPEVDAVTPLGYAHLLALGGNGSPLEILERSRALGLAAWLVAAALFGALLPARALARAAALVLLGLSVPLAAWASSGMETGLVALLAVLALVPRAECALFGGLAAGLRPELLPWAVVLSVGRALAGEAAPRERLRRAALALAFAALPAVAAAIVRQLWFGSPSPLAMVAKPSDLAHGLRYAAGALVFTGAPLLLAAPGLLRRADAATRVLALAAAAHFVAMALAGGDWMALYRLAVPVLPTVLLAGAELVALAPSSGPSIARLVLGVIPSMMLGLTVGLPARHIVEHRRALIEAAREPLEGARSVAALDIGWVGAATAAPVLDLAGVTDPMIARLPGGHTSKRVTEGLFEARRVDAVVLLLAPGERESETWPASSYARAVEMRVVRFPSVSSRELRAVLPLGGTSQRYLLIR